MALLLRVLQQLIGTKNGFQVVEGDLEIVVDHQVIVFDVVAHFADRLTHASVDDLVAVLAAVVQALALGLLGWRQDKDRLGQWHQATYLLGALPVDFQDQVVTFLEGLLQPALLGAVEVAEHFGVLEKLVALKHFDKSFAGDEVVVDPVDLARTHGAGGVRD